MTLLVFFACISFSYAQKTSETSQKHLPNQWEFGLGTGVTMPSTSFSDKTFAEDGNYFELFGAYYFSQLGLGLTLGQYNNATKNNFTETTNAFNFATANQTEDWKTTYFGIGPEYEVTFGKFKARFQTRAGILSIKPISLESSFQSTGEDATQPIPVFALNSQNTTRLSYVATGIKLDYNINPELSFSLTANYLTGLSKGITITESIKGVIDINGNIQIDKDLLTSAAGPLEFETTTEEIIPRSLNYGIGLTWHIKKKSIKSIANVELDIRNQRAIVIDSFPLENKTIGVYNKKGKENDIKNNKLIIKDQLTVVDDNAPPKTDSLEQRKGKENDIKNKKELAAIKDVNELATILQDNIGTENKKGSENDIKNAAKEIKTDRDLDIKNKKNRVDINGNIRIDKDLRISADGSLEIETTTEEIIPRSLDKNRKASENDIKNVAKEIKTDRDLDIKNKGRLLEAEKNTKLKLMGKGDKKTTKGKRFKNSYGKLRMKKRSPLKKAKK